jgi:hypothetical protein
MNFEEALRVKFGDILYTHAGEKVVISGWKHNFDNPCIKDDLYFTCIDSMMNVVQYRYNELCGFELCDEDKMFINWYEQQSKIKHSNLAQNIDIIPELKLAFLYGFHCGNSHKMINKSEEQLQK